ncbi:MAG TPA: polyphosphate kinase 1 [Chthoniobacterales bacterium]
MENRFAAPENFINRELSWLEFNRRVLEEAQDATQPLMERVKFIGIFGSNLDEFFEIRVAGIKQQIASDTIDMGPDHLTATEIFKYIVATTRELVRTQYDLWNKELVPLLAAQGIHILDAKDLDPKRARKMQKYFHNEVLPVLTPLAIDASHPFPQVLNKTHSLLVRAHKRGKKEPLYAVVGVPRVAPRLIPLATGKDEPDSRKFVYLASLIKLHISQLFPGLKIEGVHAFRVTRNSDLYIDDEEAENLLRTIEQELQKSNRGNAVRLETEPDIPEDFEQFLLDRLKLTRDDLYKLDGPLTFAHLNSLVFSDEFGKLRDRPFAPTQPPALPRHSDPFVALKKQDVLLHHPYQSFDAVVRFVEKAARDPKVLGIKMTLYRTSGDSPIVAALMNAARNGKQVTALVELKARFDEANNIQWARKLEEAGASVVYGVIGLKTHCKTLLVVRRENKRIRFYAHLGTGNYHPKTARIYTDLGLLTSNPEITTEVAALFNVLTGLTEYPGFKKLLVAPFDLSDRFLGMIQRERDHALAGKPARIVVKVNSLVDEDIIEALYEASTAGVQIELIVRGICCLRPGVPDVSENIRVISIVGRFLEHSRIFYFLNDGNPEVYLGSADWMPRNLFRRVEVCFPVEAPAIRDQIINDILPAFLTDNVKARELQSDGSYVRLKPAPGQKPTQAQYYFRRRAREAAATAAQATEAPKKLIPASRFEPEAERDAIGEPAP